MAIWRIHLKSDGNQPDRFCIDNNFLGVGWPVEDGYSGMSWDEYYVLGDQEYFGDRHKGWQGALNAIHNRMERNDLCWTRDQNGDYYLGKILGNWQYLNWCQNRVADIVNVRHCEWIHVEGVDHIPETVRNSFIRGKAIQAVKQQEAIDYSINLYAELNMQ